MNLSSQSFRKDAAIALAILIVLILLWRLMTHSEKWGGYGLLLSTNIFGPRGVQLGEQLGLRAVGGSLQGTNEFEGAISGTNTLTSGNNSSSERTSRIESYPQISQASTARTNLDASSSNVPVKVIAALPTETGPYSNISDAATFAGRLQQAGARTGDVQFSLVWGDVNDIDLHCKDPNGEEIWYSHKQSASGGRLDVDANARQPYTIRPVENIYWPAGGAPRGTYTIDVAFYARHGGSGPVWCGIQTVVRGVTNYYRHLLSAPGQRDRICSVTY